MSTQLSRTKLLIGESGISSLQNACVAIFGVGGVGSFVIEALARSGVGKLHLFDHDDIVLSNINRQIIALHSTVGRAKVDVMKERILDINPQAEVITHKCFFSKDTYEEELFKEFDYIVDAIDTVTSKLLLVEIATTLSIPIISSMGTGNKLNPTLFEITDISKTSMCPLAKVVRKELKARGIEHLKVLYSKEQPIKPITEPSFEADVQSNKRQTPGSISFVPSVAGLIIAGEVIKDIIESNKRK